MKASLLIIMMLVHLGCEQNAPSASVSMHVTSYRSTIKTGEARPQAKVAAWVNGEPIRPEAVDAKLNAVVRFREQQNRPLAPAEMDLRRRAALEALIDQTLLAQHAKSKNINISQQATKKALTAKIRHEFGDAERFRQYLAFRGMTEVAYLEEMRRDSLINAVVDVKLPTEEQVEAEFTRLFDEPASMPAIRLSVVRFHETLDIEAPKSFREIQRLNKLGRSSRHELGWVTPESDVSIPAELFKEDGPNTLTVPKDGASSVYWVHGRKTMPNDDFVRRRMVIQESLHRANTDAAYRDLVSRLRSDAAIQRIGG